MPAHSSTNVAADIRVARAAGYDGIELWIPKLARFLDAGFSTGDPRRQLGPLRVTMLPIESSARPRRSGAAEPAS